MIHGMNWSKHSFSRYIHGAFSGSFHSYILKLGDPSVPTPQFFWLFRKKISWDRRNYQGCHVVAKFSPSHRVNFWVRCASGNVSLFLPKNVQIFRRTNRISGKESSYWLSSWVTRAQRTKSSRPKGLPSGSQGPKGLRPLVFWPIFDENK